ncbi:MAG: SusC/RagA family TonB-linked outer membrane protein [Gemmatimonadetes bacterium]|nr:SusC/RagA family TonB-linked outer membrane protein [Gemmatimonadota bacterium]
MAHLPARECAPRGPATWRGLLGAVAALVLALPSAARAQQGSVSGTVVDAASARPLAGAQVVVQGTERGTLTDAAGRFQLTGLTGAQVTLDVVMLGYRTAHQPVRVGETGVRIELTQSAVELDQLVVTGTVGRETKRALGNSVARIDAATVTAKAPVQDFQSLVNGRAPGVVIIPGTGTVGSGARIRVRGVGSLSLSQEPLIYVDGVRVNNAQATGPINQAFGSSTISRWNDFNPDEIESIEIIKGPAAATLYGTEAANGVIQIITKKGAQGAPRYSFQIRGGVNWFSNPQGRLWTNYGLNPLKNNEIDTITYKDLERLNGPIFQNGPLQGYELSVSGGSPTFRYYLSGAYERNEGIEPNNIDRKMNGRANLTIVPNDKLEITASTGYMHGKVNLPLESGGGGVTWTTYFSYPNTLGTARNGFYSATPEAYRYAYQDWQDVDHFTGSVQFNYRPTSWFTHRLAIGTDLTGTEDAELVQRIADPYMQQFFSAGEIRGYKDVVDRTTYYNTVDYAATLNRNLFGLSSATSVGLQYYRRYSRFNEGYGENFPARGLKSISAASGTKTAVEDYEENTTVGTFAQEQVGWKDRLFLTAALRVDNNSAFGQDFDWVTYPKFSASWVVSDEPFWKLSPISTLKLRAAYGQSGKQPTAFASLRTYEPIPGSGDSAAVTPKTLGNPNLGPERGSELELGFDAGFLNDRLGLEFTYYDKRTSDAILLRDLPPSSGFTGGTCAECGRQYINAGEISNKGLEILARGTAYQSRNLGVELTASIATNDNKVVDLGLPGLTYVSAGTYTQHHEGYPVGSWFAKKLVAAQFDADAKVIPSSLMCDDGHGGQVACADAPEVYLGRPTPKVEGAFSTTVTLFRNLRLYGLADWKTGYKKLDGNLRVRCVLFGRCRENFYPQEFLNDPVWLAQTQLGGAYVNGLINDASFLKLREISASYTLPEAWCRAFGARAASITVAARNLYTWTKWTSLEPEASFLGGSRGGGSAQWEQNVTPQLAQFVTTVNVSF